MYSDIKRIVKLHKTLILMLGFAYGATIVFPAFGPALKVSAGPSMPVMSTLAFFCYVIGFLLPDKWIIYYTKKPATLLLLLAILSPFVLFFDKLIEPLKWVVLSGFALYAGSIGHLWTYYFQTHVPVQHKGRISALTISLTFFILYVCTILIDFVPVQMALLLPIALTYISVRQNMNFVNTHIVNKDHEDLQLVSETSIKHKEPWSLYLFFVIIYISGGFTYAGVFPKFEAYTFIAKYYNVQPLFLTVIAAGILADKIGRKNMLYIGFGFVGLSFTTFMLPPSYASYLSTQTFTQIGWGFVNTSVWVISADLAKEHRKPHIASRGVAAMLLGTVIGAVSAHVIATMSWNLGSVYGFVTHLPIFMSLTMVGLIPETLKPEHSRPSLDQILQDDINTIRAATRPGADAIVKPPSSASHRVASNPHAKSDNSVVPIDRLTTREREIAQLLANGYTRSEICSELNISINTLKTHIRHIYKKLDVSNKNALKKKMS